MMVRNNNFPIILFDIEDLLPNKIDFIEKSRHHFYDLPWDLYDVRKKQLDFLKQHGSPECWKGLQPNLLKDYYLGQAALSNFFLLINSLSLEERFRFQEIKPFRRRSVMRLLLTYNSYVADWSINRIPIATFSQDSAKIADEITLDYRAYPRQFSETKEYVMDDNFSKLVCGVANLIKQTKKNIIKLNVTIHHTYVEATPSSAGDNSPEGIHQDGYDYIVSALVVERKNIVGGISQIFAEDKKTKLFASKLNPGQGILQPDHGTSLWHNVTPFLVMPYAEVGYRSSIGFDIGVI